MNVGGVKITLENINWSSASGTLSLYNGEPSTDVVVKVAVQAYENQWWGEGEIKFFMDGDKKFPTICGTGEEDYFCGSYGYNERKQEDGSYIYSSFSSPYTGFYHVQDPKYKGEQRRFGQYRWHVYDPIRFENDLRVNIQSIGWQSEGRYLPLQDDQASVAYWYQIEPHNPFPALPSKEKLVIERD